MGCGCVFSDRALKEIKDSICVTVSAQSLHDFISPVLWYKTFTLLE